MQGKDYIRRFVPRNVLKHGSDLRRRLRGVATAFAEGANGYRLAIGRFGPFEVAYRTATADVDVLEDSFDNDVFFRSLPEYLSQPDDTIIDVGAHIGTFSLLAASKVPSGRVFAIEPCQETYNFLRVNVCLNKADNITPVRVALADAPGTATLHYDQGNWGHSIMKQLSGHSEQVSKDSLGGFCASYGITRIALIKFNCEGAEFPILLNTPVEKLREIRLMLILYHLDLAADYSLEQLLAHMQAAEFSTVIRRNEGGQRGWLVASRV